MKHGAFSFQSFRDRLDLVTPLRFLTTFTAGHTQLLCSLVIAAFSSRYVLCPCIKARLPINQVIGSLALGCMRY